MKKNQLSIRLNGIHIGILEQTANGKMSFTYDLTSTRPICISLSMPVREEPYGDEACAAYFGGLLPENPLTRKILAKKFKINSNNDFALLKEIGYDCAGAISCHALGEPEPQEIPASIPLKGRIISADELYKEIKELPQKPLFAALDEGLRLSLAGIHDKAAVCLIDNQIALPQAGCPTTYILKPSSPGYEGIAENEYFCLKIAKRIGLEVPEIALRRIKDITFLLVERYDRRVDLQQDRVARLHQEDFCQALGIPALRKYQNEGGPDFKNCFKLLNNIGIQSGKPAIFNRERLVSALVFNYLIGNTDAHAKNFSLLYSPFSSINSLSWPAPHMAPLYDIVCTRVYPELTNKMAMKIGSKYEADQVLPRHWKELCEEIRYRYPAIKSLIENMSAKIIQAAIIEKQELETAGHSIKIILKVIEVIQKNIESTLKKFKMDLT